MKRLTAIQDERGREGTEMNSFRLFVALAITVAVAVGTILSS